MTDELGIAREVFRADPHDPPPELPAWIKSRVLAEAVDERTPSLPTALRPSRVLSRRRDQRLHRRIVVGGLVAATAAAASVVGVALVPSGVTTKALIPSAAAATVLDGIARVAAAQSPFSPPPAGEYMYTRTAETDLEMGSGQSATSPTYNYYDTTYTRQWRTAAGAGRTKITYSIGKFLTPHDRTTWENEGKQARGGQPSTQTYGPSRHRAAEYLSPKGLPANASRLVPILEAQYGHNGGSPSEEASGVLSSVTTLLDQAGVRPSLRASLLEALGRIPGLKSFGAVAIDGTRGEAIGVGFGGFRFTSVFDAKTSRVLARQTFLTNPKAAKSTLGYKDADLSQDVLQLKPGLLWYDIVYSTPRLTHSISAR